MSRKVTTENFITRSQNIHGNDRYDYTNVVYKAAKTNVAIKCNICSMIFEQMPDKHLAGHNCPYCVGKKTSPFNCLAARYPHLCDEWHLSKNKEEFNLSPYDVTPGSGKKVWWRCKKNHEWLININHRTIQASQCPYCCNQKLCNDNSFSILFPQLCLEWSDKNECSPIQFQKASNVKVWWICSHCRYEWQATLGSRTTGYKTDCPACAGKVITSTNCLSFTHPELTAEWHPIKNKPLNPVNVTFGSKEKVWWICSHCGHEWRTSVNNRGGVNKRGCSMCAGYSTHRGQYLSPVSGAKHIFQSSWEEERMKYHDSNYNFYKWDRCKDKITYLDSRKNIIRRYNPDFEITFFNNIIVVEEVKGILGCNAEDKFDAAIHYYSNIGKHYQMISKVNGMSAYEGFTIVNKNMFNRRLDEFIS